MFALKINELYQKVRSLAHYGKDKIILVFPLEILLFRLKMATVLLDNLFWVCIFVTIAEDGCQDGILRVIV